MRRWLALPLCALALLAPPVPARADRSILAWVVLSYTRSDTGQTERVASNVTWVQVQGGNPPLLLSTGVPARPAPAPRPVLRVGVPAKGAPRR